MAPSHAQLGELRALADCRRALFPDRNDRGFASCFDAKSGAPTWAGHKLSRGAHASLVSAEGLVYFTVDDGTTYIIRPGKELDIAENALGERVFAAQPSAKAKSTSKVTSTCTDGR